MKLIVTQVSPISTISFLLDSNIYKAISMSSVFEHELLQWTAPAQLTKFGGFWRVPNDCNWTTLTWLVV